MNQEKKPWQLARRNGTELRRKGATVLRSMSRQSLEKRHPTKQCVVVVKRRRDGYVRNGPSPSGVQSREDSGAGLRTAAYGRPCVPHWQKREFAENSAMQATTKEEKSSVPPTGADLLREATG